MRQAGLAVRPRQHPGQLGLARVALDDAHARRHPAVVLMSRHHEVAIGERRHLGEVGHHEYLTAPRQRGEPGAHRHARGPADARVDLVEDQHGRRVRLAEHALHREHHPRDLASRRDPRQRPGFVRPTGCVEELDVLRPLVRPAIERPLPQRDVEPRALHGEGAGRRGEVVHETRGRLPPHPREPLAGLAQARLHPGDLLLGALDRRLALVQLLELGLGAPGGLEHRRECGTVLAHEPLQRSQTGLDPLELLGLVLDAVGVRPQPHAEIVDGRERRARLLRQRVELGVHPAHVLERRHGLGEPVLRSALVAERVTCGVRRLFEPLTVPKARQRLPQLLVLALLRGDGLDLLQLEAQVVRTLLSLLESRPEIGERLANRLGLGEGGSVPGACLLRRRPRVAIQEAGMRGGPQQPLMVVLAVQFHQRSQSLAQLTHGGETVVQVAA